MDTLLEDRFGLVDVELGLEIAEVVAEAAAVGAATGIVEVEALIMSLFAYVAPGDLLTSSHTTALAGKVKWRKMWRGI